MALKAKVNNSIEDLNEMLKEQGFEIYIPEIDKNNEKEIDNEQENIKQGDTEE